ncbi:MCE family protein [Mycolicibacterium sphagni]|uniref:MCE family protein n=1 Tax=Mycolicibacterium sphagni TaxID=1786 RepID=UPI0021F2BE5C|nr:MCE family protein [Mycolicibacterium sphagni]MCV7175373.1 MCE family protein [Mycolicibacterium sphagni]
MTVLVIAAIVAGAAAMFRGDFTKTVPLTVMSPRAGLVMNPDAKVELLGVQVGNVRSIETLPNGQAALHLEMDPVQLQQIPSNVVASIASTTVFGAKYVQLLPPQDPSPTRLQPGQVLTGEHVTVEINTVFQQLISLLAHVDPPKLNQTLGAIAAAFNDRGNKIGQSLVDLDTILTKLDPSLPTLEYELQIAPGVVDSYADAAPDLLDLARNSTRISQTIVDDQHNLDAFLVSTIGLADIGNDVLGANEQPLAKVLHLLAPTTDLTHEYSPALNCALAGMLRLSTDPPLPLPGAVDMVGLDLGRERYRYPANLPKVAATGGPQCTDLPNVPFGATPPFVVTDIGANPAQYGNQGILLNSDGLKQLLFGPLDGPPRNSAQIGQPG